MHDAGQLVYCEKITRIEGGREGGKDCFKYKQSNVLFSKKTKKKQASENGKTRNKKTLLPFILFQFSTGHYCLSSFCSFLPVV
jgi:hypothetical protein